MMDNKEVLIEDNNIDTESIERFETFDQMITNTEILRGIYSYGFEKPSAIQQVAIKPIADGKDIIAQAQSGTGKTATFSLGVLQRINPEHNVCQAILLVPTRELAEQINNVIISLCKFTNITTHLCIGGTSVREDKQKLSNGVHIVIGTPGRTLQLISENALNTEHIKVFVLDEADEMLSKGFKPQVYDIFRFMPNDIQCAIFSATMPNDVLDVTKNFMRNPMKILVKNAELTLQGIKQFYIAIEMENWKLDTLCDLYSTMTVTQVIIYCNTRRKVEFLANEMMQRNFVVSQIHGDMTSTERNSVMKSFRSGSSRILIATDIIARGIDVQQVSLVINYDIPNNRENYIHRIGRTGRFGRKGLALNFITDKDEPALADIEKFYNTNIHELPADIGNIFEN
jgi:translation initiation factor 4A